MNAYRRHGPRALTSVLAAFVILLLAPLHAQATFSSAATGQMSASSGTLAPPTNPTNAKSCVLLALGKATYTTNWTISPSTYATGYTVVIMRNGVVDSTNAVAGRTTATASWAMDYHVDYTFTIRTVYLNWTSTVATPATPIQCTIVG